MDNVSPAIIVGLIVSVVVFLYTDLVETVVMNSLFGIIYVMADQASSYNPLCGTLIRAIPSIIAAGLSFGTIMAIAKIFSFE